MVCYGLFHLKRCYDWIMPFGRFLYFPISTCLLKFRKYFPVKTVTARPNDKPWFNSSMRKAIRLRERLHQQLNVPIQFFFWVNIRYNEEKFENTNRVIRMTYNTMVKTNNDLHNITQKTNYRVTRTPLKTGDELLHI